VSGKAAAAGIAANPDDQEPAASALPLTYFSNDGDRRWAYQRSMLDQAFWQQAANFARCQAGG